MWPAHRIAYRDEDMMLPPLPHRLVRDDDPAGEQYLLDFAEAEREAMDSHTPCAMISAGYRNPLYDGVPTMVPPTADRPRDHPLRPGHHQVDNASVRGSVAQPEPAADGRFERWGLRTAVCRLQWPQRGHLRCRRPNLAQHLHRIGLLARQLDPTAASLREPTGPPSTRNAPQERLCCCWPCRRHRGPCPRAIGLGRTACRLGTVDRVGAAGQSDQVEQCPVCPDVLLAPLGCVNS